MPNSTTTQQGTLVGTVMFPWPWPPVRDIVMLRQRLDDGGSVSLHSVKRGVLRAELARATENIELVSCPIFLLAPTVETIFVTWTWPNLEIIVGDNNIVASHRRPTEAPSEFWLAGTPRSRTGQHDFSLDNEAALKKRRDTLAGSLGGSPMKPGRERAGDEHIFQALSDELLQLRDLLDLARGGKLHHALGLSARLRLLIIKGTPLPLLQLCAATLNKPLLIYTAAQPRLPRPADVPAAAHSLNFTASATPTFLLQNPIDLDVWLTLDATRHTAKPLTNWKLLKKIGDTVGAHYDVDVDLSVKALQQSIAGFSGTEVNFFVEYVCRAAEVTTALAARLLDQKSAQPEGVTQR